ncbi:hypothetical protein [Geodermatophilus sp. DSM 44513]|uniref:hypothetical protein n=1 Tax=Geodermatophilus sp. DSM 44513 TaxID=1528104 RepID=UPI0014134206|nr:hypothetical protein [Geodermatophilus sp. DSM 44513]WNV74332.1 hypothetical protein RTG05_15215 [Geodermatophilus sp. DSM 44513]
MDLDGVADELYAVPPEEFVAVRTQRQHEARAAGDRTLAREVGALPKPTVAAWVCNLLAREQRAEVEGLVELGDLLRQAQESLAGDQLRALDRQRAQLLGALTRQATALARERGTRVGGAVEAQVTDTLRAAMADPEAGAALLSGRLAAAMSYSGLGTTGTRPALRIVPARTGPTRETAGPRSGAAARRAAEEETRRAAEERRHRALEEARRAAEEATAAAAEAVAAAGEERQRVDDLDARRADLQARVAELSDELARTEEQATRTAEELRRAERQRRAAERHATEAAEARDRSLAALRALEQH